MGFLNGPKVLWSDPELRNKTIAYTLGATAVTCAATYAVTKAVTRRGRGHDDEGRIITIDGELYRELPNGELRPFFNRAQQVEAYEEYECEDYEAYDDTDDLIYIKGRPYAMDDCGNYVPVRMPSDTRRKPSKKHYK